MSGFNALFPTLTTPLRYPPTDLPHSALSGGGARGVVVKLGALSPEARSTANQTLERLSSLSRALERDLYRLTNRGDAVPGALATEIRLNADEIEQLETNLDSVDSDTDLRMTWAEWARQIESVLASLRVQLDAFESATGTTRMRYVALGAVGAVALGAVGAYYVYRKGRR